MKEIPILYSTDMVQACLADTKTQTRRTTKLEEVNKRPNDFIKPILDTTGEWVFTSEFGAPQQVRVKCPYGKPGDLLWVRESFFDSEPYRNAPLFFNNERYYYKADETFIGDHKWKPSIHMPKAAARIWLLNESVHLERLQDITEQDAIAEGVLQYDDGTYKNYFKRKGLREQDGVECLLAIGSFQSLICSINGMDIWDANPWVWVVKFRVVSTTGRENVRI